VSDLDFDDSEELVLGDLLNRVLDKGVVISGSVTIAVADIDLVRVGLNLVLSSVETEERTRRRLARAEERGGDPPVLRPTARE
jgi:hypothetical protein